MKMSIKSALLVATIIGFAALPALAQNNGSGGQGQGGPGQGQQFDAMKADILQHLKQAEACVQAATDFDALRACRPQRGGRGGGQGGQGGPGGGQGGPPDDSTSKSDNLF